MIDALGRMLWTGLTVKEEGDLAGCAFEALGFRVAISGIDRDCEFQTCYDILTADSCRDIYFTCSPHATTSSFKWWSQARHMSIVEVVKCLSEAVAFAEYDSLDHKSPTPLKSMTRNPFHHKHGCELAVLVDLASNSKNAREAKNFKQRR